MSARRLMLFGSLVHPDVVASLPEASEAANRFQLGLLQGLVAAGLDRATAVSQLPVRARLVGTGLRTAPGRWSLDERIHVVAPAYLNAKPIKPFAAHASLRRAGMAAAGIGPQAVLCYNPVPGPASAGLAVARQLRVPFVTIAADFVPPSADLPPLRRVQFRWALHILRSSDGLVVLSGHTVRDLGIDRPWIKIDGGLTDDWNHPPPVEPLPKTVVYAGTPAEVSGTRLLLDAFSRIPDADARLVVCGRGGLEEEVREAAASDPRIRFQGFLERPEMQRLLQSASVLVNPRQSVFRENRYNFPAKLLDYLAAGRPVITTLAGDLDPEYKEVTIPLREETPEALTRLIQAVCARPETELSELGARGRAFVLATRRWEHQAGRILEFIEQLVKRPA